MTIIKPNSIVNLSYQRTGELRYPPSNPGGIFVIAAHEGALKSSSKSTQVVQIRDGALVWVGAVDEDMVAEVGETYPDARRLLANHLLRGPSLWEVLPSVGLWSRIMPYETTTIYKGNRPWIVVGETGVSILAAPLNHYDPGDRIETYQSFISAKSLQVMVTPGPRDSKLEMNHIWSFPKNIPGVGSVAAMARPNLERRVMYYYGLTS